MIEDLLSQILEEQKETNKLLKNLLVSKNDELNIKDPYELLTREQVMKEFNVGLSKSLRMFNDPDLPVQRYVKPFRVQRKAVIEYFGKSHDYLCNN